MPAAAPVVAVDVRFGMATALEGGMTAAVRLSRNIVGIDEGDVNGAEMKRPSCQV